MIVTCNECGQPYDDADRSTICPHFLIMEAGDLAQKKRGLALLGEMVVFAHRPDGVTPARVTSVGWNGMVTIEGFAGEFSPDLFVIVPGSSNG